MINFILCDDNEVILKDIKELIDKVMINNKLAYKTHTFKDYNASFVNIIEKDLTSKIYILDIETPSASGIDMARKIRENDIDSIIIFLTSHEELGSILLHDEIMFLTFICKYNDMNERVTSSIKKALSMVGVKQALRFEDHGIIYTINLNTILYITTDTIDRKTVVITEQNEFKVGKGLQEIADMLDNRFKQSHRSCFVNMDRVIKIDKRKNEITFDNNIKIPLLSESFKKELVK